MKLLVLTLALALPTAAQAEPLNVQASNDVLAMFAQRLAGDAATVTMPVPDGTDPATWQPRIAAIAAVQDAGLIVLNGAGYEAWPTRVSLPRARTVDTTHGMDAELIRLAGQSHSHGSAPTHSHDGVAPVVWLDFSLAARQAGAIAAALTRALPDASVAANLAALQADLADLDAEAKALGAAMQGQTLLVWQPGYEYFGRAYGIPLREVTFDAAEPPTPAQLAALDAAVADTQARLMLWDAAPPPDTATALAARGIMPVIFTTAANPPEGADVLAMLQANLAALRAALDPA
jgi:zinc transport system substrate-binding protein